MKRITLAPGIITSGRITSDRMTNPPGQLTSVWSVGLMVMIAMAGCKVQTRGSVAGPADPDAPTEFTVTESGLKYRILRKGSGQKPTATSRVVVDYAGWLDNNREFDNSYLRRESTSFQLNGVIPGWTEGLQLVSEGGMIELEIPAELGYGLMPQPGIPPGSTLHFKVELHEVK